MATFVLVAGAWLGGWCWRHVVPILRNAGHDVVTPSLTGLGERAHLLTPTVGLDTHVLDLETLFVSRDLRDAFLRTSPPTSFYQRFLEQGRGNGWYCRELEGGHFAMLTAPHAVATVLLDLERDWRRRSPGVAIS